MASSNKANRGSHGRVKTGPRGNGAGQVRIIAGRWRGRKLAVPCVTGLRPTGDRLRETLFNWLQADVAGAHCLDLFAGSGALGFEALSRYAASVSFVETDSETCRTIQKACELLGVMLREQPIKVAQKSPPDGRNSPAETATRTVVCERDVPVAHIHSGTAANAIAQWTKSQYKPEFDLVFIDPPFESACQWEMLQELTPTLLAEGALVYLESPTVQGSAPNLPSGCKLVREKRFGDVSARLVRYSSASENDN